jgi:hypothetical protein
MHRLIVPQKYKLNTFLSTVCPTPSGVSETSLGKEHMSLKIGDNYVATSEDGEAADGQSLRVAYWCDGEFEYLIEKERLALVAGELRAPQ